MVTYLPDCARVALPGSEHLSIPLITPRLTVYAGLTQLDSSCLTLVNSMLGCKAKPQEIV